MTTNKTVHINQQQFTVSSGCADWVWESWEKGDWQKDTLNIFDRFIHPEKDVIDMGAWIGPLSLYAATRTSGNIHSIEPDKTSYGELAQNFHLNPEYSSRLFAHPVAIGAENTTATLYGRRNFGDSASSLLSRTKDRGLKQEVQVQTFESFLQENNIKDVGFLKMDIEAGEFALLPAMADWLKEHKPNFHLSLHTPFLREAYFKQFSSNWWGRHLNKFEAKTGSTFISDKYVLPQLNTVLDILSNYEFIYTEDGSLLDIKEIISRKLYRETIDLVFTNQKW